MKTRTINSLLQRLLALAITMTFFCAQIFAQGGNAPVKTNTKINYHDGPVMQGTSNVYLIWYGNWIGNTAQSIITDLVLNLGFSTYFQINALYPDANGIAPNSGLIY